MSDISREEMQAEIKAVEARLDARVAEIGGEIKLLASSVNSLNTNITNAASEARSDQKNTRITMVVTGIAVVIGLAAAVWQMQTGLLDAFQAGLTAKQVVVPTKKSNGDG